MIITYLGKEFFKISQGDLTIAINPISKDSKLPLKPSKFGADIALVTTGHPDFNGLEMLSRGTEVPVTSTGAGEYEVKDVSIKGVGSGVSKNGNLTTVYRITLENISICFLGPITELTNTAREICMNPEILFVPVGDETHTPEAMYKIAASLEPLIIIPMEYEGVDSPMLKKFLKLAADEEAPRLDKLVLKRKDLDGKEGDVMVLIPEL